MASEELVIGLVSISDRASQGVYKDEGIPALEEWFGAAIAAPAWKTMKRLIPDERPVIEATLKELGLDEHLSPQRANGLRSMVKRIKRDAEAALKQTA